ncbi:gliding motility lipoprotein GldB [Tamlana sp. s12]|nr:gliding motility protein GldB [Tamlana sp. s12]QQY84048.1 gliding motility lipoprotein GldB [Tamlana sp. s12]
MKLLLVFVLATVVSCKTENALEHSIAKINTDIQVERFDRLFAETTPENLGQLKQDYPFMFSNKYPDAFWLEKKEDSLQVELFGEVNQTFTSFDPVEFEIESLFNHLKYYFPEFKAPRVITVTNDVDYRNRVIVTDTIAVIALDAYLGRDHKYYGSIPMYLREQLDKKQIVVDMATAYSEKLIFQPKRKSFLDEMIYFGKQLYFKDVILPFKTEAERIGYTEAQLDWATVNEAYIWRYFVERELLFSTDSKLPSRFINPAPFSKFYLAEIDADSPGQIGQYIGWQIVSAYMKNNKVSFKDMLQKSSEEIFNNSKFKPRK